jgi:RNA polymerase sigma factor (sigma-70 family)
VAIAAGATGPGGRLRGENLGQIARAAAAGDERAWTLLVDHFGATIRSIARRHGLSDADQDDVAQNTWARLVRHLGALRDPAAIGGWIVTTARHEALRLRAACREVAIDDASLIERLDPVDTEDLAYARQCQGAVHRALALLPERQRAMMRLLLAEPALSYDQISAQLGMPRGSIGPTRARCLERLRHDSHLLAVASHAHGH